MSKPIVSLCMPTNGVIEWVFPVLDSIYSQNVENDLFEVVITDNGDNVEFKKSITEYLHRYKNIKYAETQAAPFINEIESYKRASGELIKFVNHRTKLLDGALEGIIDFALQNRDIKPVIYFSNGVLKKTKGKHEYDTFDLFVRNLSYWSSWSTGMAIWKEDFDKLPGDVNEFNELFPHTNVLFNERNRNRYIIDNSVIFDEIPQGNKPKGKYDLYYAFGVEYPRIIESLVKDGSISKQSFDYVAEKNLELIAAFYWHYNIRKEYCSYDLSGFEGMFDIYYSKTQFFLKTTRQIVKEILKKTTEKQRVKL